VTGADNTDHPHSDQHSTRRRNPAEIAAALSAWLPARLDAQAVQVTDLAAPKGAGFSNQTYLFTAAWNGRAAALVLQAAPAGPGLFQRYDIGLMARVQRQLGAVSQVPVAPVRWYEADAAVLGVPFYVMDRVAGRVPTDNPSYHRAGWFAELPAAAQIDTWWSGIDAMAQLHALDPARDGFGFLADGPWGIAPGADAAARRVAQLRDYLAWSAADPFPLISAALDELDRTRPAPAPLAVHWGDAKISNCVVADNRVRALLDWELCGLSDPEEDLTHWLMLDWSQWAAAGGTRLPRLPDAAATIAHYEKVSGRTVRAALWWFRLATVRLAIIYHRIQARRRAIGRLAPDTELAGVNPIGHLIAPLFDRDRLP
jgi:aminoglycoside phosphotransferase (APT) family kinase protein